ncbi:MAG: Nramp family divalent metal transporter, partial [Acidobacteriia bacterium]|nr:Nramp family divalent metal transporter [Terriglobia bacterium]
MVPTEPATETRSLADVHGSVGTSQVSFWRRMFAFAGPAYLVSVGYMDPGNWATDLEGGARFGYQLLWVLVMSNAMAVLLQTLSSRLGIVSGRDLAQACRETYPRPVNLALWGLCEIAIAACDLAEVLGAAIGLNLLFHIPLLVGVLITAGDTLLILWLQSLGIRTIEAFVLGLITVIGACFCVEILWAHPPAEGLLAGLVPRLNTESLYVAIGILGATVMPHNLYLHSALVQTRHIGHSEANKKTACRYNLIDSVVALNGALLVNAAILVMAAAVFFRRHIVVTEIQQAHLLLAPLLGTSLAGIFFAVALLCSGQSSTLTGTLAGQVVVEGFLNLRVRPWLRRLITRAMAVVPAALTIYISGDKSTYQLIILSQVILSLQLPFAVIPLIHFTSDRGRMGRFRNPAWVRTLSWIAAIVIVGLNLRLAVLEVADWLRKAGAFRPIVLAATVISGALLLFLLLWVTMEPLISRWVHRYGLAPLTLPEPARAEETPAYQRILVPLDHSALDRLAIGHAA